MAHALLVFKFRRTYGHLGPLDICVPLLQHNTVCERDLGAWDRPLPQPTPLQKVGLLLGVFICYHLHLHPVLIHPFYFVYKESIYIFNNTLIVSVLAVVLYKIKKLLNDVQQVA